jgi:hypothetical protein
MDSMYYFFDFTETGQLGSPKGIDYYSFVVHGRDLIRALFV